jgi:hypothetical protein
MILQLKYFERKNDDIKLVAEIKIKNVHRSLSIRSRKIFQNSKF